jgi:hypothetical protein
MDQHEAVDFVIHALGKGHSGEEVARAVCERTGWPWQHVERFVRKVELEHRDAIDVVRVPQTAPAQQRPADATLPSQGHPVEAATQRTPQRPQPVAEFEATEETVEFVIRELARHRSRDNIVNMLCEQTGGGWREVERFVRRVEIEHHDTIAARQSPLVIMLGAGSIVVGAAMTLYSVYLIMNAQIDEFSVGLLITGPALLVGGIAGIWRVVSMMRG